MITKCAASNCRGRKEHGFGCCSPVFGDIYICALVIRRFSLQLGS